MRSFRVEASTQGLTYVEALHEALCFGWIDGVRRSHDEVSFTQRFTPRKPRSIWSQVNVAKAEMLIREGRMMPAGLAAFEAREESRTGLYSFERAAMELAPEYVKRFRTVPAAWAYFEGRAPGYRRLCTYWVMSAKRPATQLRRLGELIESSAAGRSIGLLGRPSDKAASKRKK